MKLLKRRAEHELKLLTLDAAIMLTQFLAEGGEEEELEDFVHEQLKCKCGQCDPLSSLAAEKIVVSYIRNFLDEVEPTAELISEWIDIIVEEFQRRGMTDNDVLNSTLNLN